MQGTCRDVDWAASEDEEALLFGMGMPAWWSDGDTLTGDATSAGEGKRSRLSWLWLRLLFLSMLLLAVRGLKEWKRLTPVAACLEMDLVEDGLTRTFSPV